MSHRNLIHALRVAVGSGVGRVRLSAAVADILAAVWSLGGEVEDVAGAFVYATIPASDSSRAVLCLESEV